MNDLSTRDLKKLRCDCQTRYSDFVYKPHGHVHTGCLDIIDCPRLREIMKKGAESETRSETVPESETRSETVPESETRSETVTCLMQVYIFTKMVPPFIGYHL